MIDYGALVKINGRIVNKGQFFMDMQEAVGWVDYPRIRYEDCDCLEDDCSNCGECPRAQKKHMSDPELGEWDHITGDCRGNALCISNKIDRNYFAYVGDEDFTVAVYKNWAVFTGKAIPKRFSLWEVVLDDTEDWTINARRMVKKFCVQVGDETVSIKARKITQHGCRIYMKFRYKGNLYELVYGCGIDSAKEVWDKTKKYYADKKSIRFVDNFWEEK
jgi:hypothetical protein